MVNRGVLMLHDPRRNRAALGWDSLYLNLPCFENGTWRKESVAVNGRQLHLLNTGNSRCNLFLMNKIHDCLNESTYRRTLEITTEPSPTTDATLTRVAHCCNMIVGKTATTMPDGKPSPPDQLTPDRLRYFP